MTELEAIAASYALTGATPATDGWRTLEWVVFIRALPVDISLDRLQRLDDRHRLTASMNAELSMYWLPLLVRADDRRAAPTVEAFLSRVGRHRMIRPLYEAMVAKGEPWRALAKQTYERAKPLYHPIVRDTLRKIVGS